MEAGILELNTGGRFIVSHYHGVVPPGRITLVSLRIPNIRDEAILCRPDCRVVSLPAMTGTEFHSSRITNPVTLSPCYPVTFFFALLCAARSVSSDAGYSFLVACHSSCITLSPGHCNAQALVPCSSSRVIPQLFPAKYETFLLDSVY